MLETMTGLSVRYWKPDYFYESTKKSTFQRTTMKESDPNGVAANTPGAKLDSGKSPLFRGTLDYFPRALSGVAEVSLYGANKYAWKGWETVPDGYNRYSDALGRHLVKESIEGLYDVTDSQLLHCLQVAWNALARAEMIMKEGHDVYNPDR